MTSDAPPTPVLPDYAGACVSNIVPALLQHAEIGRGWLPDEVLDAPQVVLLVLDGLGYEQLVERALLAPTLVSMLRGPITTVAPTTTATALTSITTGAAPGEHGLVGYRMRVAGELLNALRWTSPLGDARERIDPAELQPIIPFVGTGPPVVSHAAFADSGFTRAHLRDTRYVRYWLPSSIPVDVGHLLREGASFVYAYYDGIDKMAHITGLDMHYDAELAAVDSLVATIVETLPAGAALVVTADHGQVQVGERLVPIAPAVLELTAHISGEARFAWLHAPGDRAGELFEAAAEAHGDEAWVAPRERVLDEGWLGKAVSSAARARLGDVAVVARAPIALVDPANPGPLLEGRHGSLTPEEVFVPLLTAVG